MFKSNQLQSIGKNNWYGCTIKLDVAEQLWNLWHFRCSGGDYLPGIIGSAVFIPCFLHGITKPSQRFIMLLRISTWWGWFLSENEVSAVFNSVKTGSRKTFQWMIVKGIVESVIELRDLRWNWQNWLSPKERGLWQTHEVDIKLV